MMSFVTSKGVAPLMFQATFFFFFFFFVSDGCDCQVNPGLNFNQILSWTFPTWPIFISQ